jgi:hypothetical protein
MIDPFFRGHLCRDTNAAQCCAVTRNHWADCLFIAFIITAGDQDVGNSLPLASKTVHGETKGEQTTPDGADE